MICEDLKLAEFLRGELAPPESQAVLSHVENCQVCRERIRVMAILEARFQQETPSKQLRTRRYLMAAAAVVILGLTLLTYHSVWSPVSTVEGEQFSAADPYPYFPLELRFEGMDSYNEKLRKTAFEAYVTGDYGKANSILEGLAQKDRDPELKFYLGVTHYLLGNPDKALQCLGDAAKTPRWKAPSQWYMANLLLRNGKEATAAELLQELRDGGGEFSVESTGLLQTLKQ
jgi:tetratricopeptide (TPR) repeat protein